MCLECIEIYFYDDVIFYYCKDCLKKKNNI